MTEKV